MSKRLSDMDLSWIVDLPRRRGQPQGYVRILGSLVRTGSEQTSVCTRIMWVKSSPSQTFRKMDIEVTDSSMMDSQIVVSYHLDCQILFQPPPDRLPASPFSLRTGQHDKRSFAGRNDRKGPSNSCARALWDRRSFAMEL